jgi:hypothetical protein
LGQLDDLPTDCYCVPVVGCFEFYSSCIEDYTGDIPIVQLKWIPIGSLLLGEFIGDKLHIVDAIQLGSKCLKPYNFEQRKIMCEKFCQALTVPGQHRSNVSNKTFYTLEKLPLCIPSKLIFIAGDKFFFWEKDDDLISYKELLRHR